jgi:lysozyme
MKRGAKVTVAGGTVISGIVGIAMMLQTIVTGWEGKTNVAVLPLPDDVPTICWGNTKGVKMGDTATDAECVRFLRVELDHALAAVDKAIKVEISDEERAAYASLVYNVGAAAFASSTLVKKVNRHDRLGGCNELPRWNKFKGKPLNGLTRRRAAERLLCLQGLQ